MSALLSIVMLEDGAANCDVESVGVMTLGLHHRRFLEPTICNPWDPCNHWARQANPSSTRGNKTSAKIHVQKQTLKRDREGRFMLTLCVAWTSQLSILVLLSGLGTAASF